MALKIAFGMIVFEGDYVLHEALESVYPYAEQILIAEGPVQFWQDRGKVTSTDKTNQIIDNFPDPEGKISIVHGQFAEKDEQCRAYMPFLNDDIDYIWNLDSDEVFKGEDIEKIIEILEKEKYTSVGVRSCSFYGGCNHYISGFEQMKDNFLRIFKVYPGANWLTHRPPTIVAPEGVETLPEKHLDSETLWRDHGVQMYHYSYVFPTQVKNKLEYYKAKVSKQYCHPNYFDDIYLPWVTGNREVEKAWKGVHEFNPNIRMHSFTEEFSGSHPVAILKSMDKLTTRLHDELQRFLEE